MQLHFRIIALCIALGFGAGLLAQQEIVCKTPTDQECRDRERTPTPKLPRIVHACPGEGCQLGRWTALRSVAVFSTWKAGGRRVGWIRRGESVEASESLFITYRPDKVRILSSGEIAYVYDYCGEGRSNFRLGGYWFRCFPIGVASGGSMPRLGECAGLCSAHYVRRGHQEWWVKVTAGDHKTGWVRVNDNFSV